MKILRVIAKKYNARFSHWLRDFWTFYKMSVINIISNLLRFLFPSWVILRLILRSHFYFIWDMASMSHKASVEALDREMRDLRSSNCPMGDCTVLFSGDIRQILPVITRVSRWSQCIAQKIISLAAYNEMWT